MKILSQRNPQWANQKLGKSFFNIGRYGCTITCISMLTDYFSQFSGIFKTPKDLAQGLEFTEEGYLVWSSLLKITQMRLEKRLYNRDDVSIIHSLKDPKRAVILQVDGFHWIIALKKLPFGVYWIADPWTGTKRFSTAYNKITGSAHLILQ